MENNRGITVAVLCNLLGRGDTYDEWSTSFVIALSKMKEIIKIHVITLPQRKNTVYTYKLPDKCISHEVLDYDHPFSMIRAVNLVSGLECDLAIVVSGPTAFGRGSVSNFIGLLLPLMIKIKTKAEVKIRFKYFPTFKIYVVKKKLLSTNFVWRVSGFIYPTVRGNFLN